MPKLIVQRQSASRDVTNTTTRVELPHYGYRVLVGFALPPHPFEIFVSDAGRLLAPDHGGDELLAIRAGGLSGVNVTRVNEFPGRDLVFACPASAAACASTSEIRPIADTCNSAYRSR